MLPSLMHGGPGRAGGGEELGGLNGLVVLSPAVSGAGLGGDAVGAGGGGGGSVGGIAIATSTNNAANCGRWQASGDALDRAGDRAADDRHAARRAWVRSRCGRIFRSSWPRAPAAACWCIRAMGTVVPTSCWRSGRSSSCITKAKWCCRSCWTSWASPADHAGPQRWRIDRAHLRRQVSGTPARADSGSAARVRRGPERREHRAGKG